MKPGPSSPLLRLAATSTKKYERCISPVCRFSGSFVSTAKKGRGTGNDRGTFSTVPGPENPTTPDTSGSLASRLTGALRNCGVPADVHMSVLYQPSSSFGFFLKWVALESVVEGCVRLKQNIARPMCGTPLSKSRGSEAPQAGSDDAMQSAQRCRILYHIGAP